MQLNYFGAIKLVHGAAAAHAASAGRGHVVNVSSIGVQTNPPRFSAYVASKAALDAWTRVVSSEIDRRQHHLHDDPHAARAHADDRADEDVRLVPDDHARRGRATWSARRSAPSRSRSTRGSGTFGEVAYALAPKAVDQILHMAYKVFPDSAAAKGEKDEQREGNGEAIAMANLMKGVHW